MDSYGCHLPYPYHIPPPNDPDLPSPAKEQIRSLPRYSLSAPSKAIQPNLRRHGAGFYLAKMMRFGNDASFFFRNDFLVGDFVGL